MSTAQLRAARLTAVPLGMLATMALLLMMASLIKTELVFEPQPEAAKIVNVIMPEVKTIEPKYPELVRPKEPVVAPPTDFETSAPVVSDVFSPYTVSPPDSVGTIGPIEIGQGDDLLPRIKVAPNYPRAAASRGIEGEVVVSYIVTRSGATRDVQVVSAVRADGSPTTIFNRSAIAAAEKFKYKPRENNGIAIEVHNVQNRFVFELGD
ncbi:energy transducer TonB [Gilvimarinus sp. 1_MG-2023]|uniref:energy transducer TonB n=1 Tax=Gilvimarinus sp. 1_MG-2023 TaxID=3062638 RepID=UPI0026E3C3C6|nr:energy transducer TonB [Gilvimarinus sp. 1_MG-2023]MDO6748337.1 TonB family protein [Gilvimarinus sp. 1_MG-2023]